MCRTDFTIHGLWPDFDDGTFPSFCNKTDQFDIDLVRDLLPQLETEWPSYTVRGGDDFWAYEYAKHGTCAKATFRNEHEYFAGVLGLNEEYNLLVRLSCCIFMALMLCAVWHCRVLALAMLGVNAATPWRAQQAAG